jgi:hypothetical protein
MLQRPGQLEKVSHSLLLNFWRNWLIHSPLSVFNPIMEVYSTGRKNETGIHWQVR